MRACVSWAAACRLPADTGGAALALADPVKTRVIPESKWPWYEDHGATLGIQAWVTAQPPES